MRPDDARARLAALGYLTLDAAVRATLTAPPARVRLVVCEATFPTGMLGHYTRRLADAAQTDDDLASLRDDPRFPAPN